MPRAAGQSYSQRPLPLVFAAVCGLLFVLPRNNFTTQNMTQNRKILCGNYGAHSDKGYPAVEQTVLNKTESV